MKELTDYRRWAWNCFRDSQCKQVFPWHVKTPNHYQICPSLNRYKFDCYSAQGKLDLARAIIEGEMKWSDKLLEVIYQDPLCGACDYICGRIKEMQPGSIIQAMRAKAIRDGCLPPAGFASFLAELRQYMNPYGKYDAERLNWLVGLTKGLSSVPIIGDEKSRPRNLLYVGCFPLRDKSAEKMAQNAASLLLKAGIDIGVLGQKERCCGNPSLRMGDVDSFVAFARENIESFNKLGIENLVTICPFCYSTFRRDYPEVGQKMNFKVLHILELIEDYVIQGKLKYKNKVDITVTYHDPCHLGRICGSGISGTGTFAGLYNQPRSILAGIPGIKLREMDRNKDDAWCCGGGSWLKEGYPELAGATADNRIDEAVETGADALITCCPHCEENLGESIQRRGNKMKIFDLLDLVQNQLRLQ